jgi:peptide deformylase
MEELDSTNTPMPEGRILPIITSRMDLKQVCEPFDFENPQMDPLQLAADLVRTMHDHQGLGLAANQIGYPYRVFAMRTAPKNTVVFNPKIIHNEPETETLDEGCLSFPGLVVKIKRWKLIRVRFAYPNGEVKTETYKGLTSRVFQHEFGHLNGEIFYELATKYHRDLAERKMMKRQRYKKEEA